MLFFFFFLFTSCEYKIENTIINDNNHIIQDTIYRFNPLFLNKQTIDTSFNNERLIITRQTLMNKGVEEEYKSDINEMTIIHFRDYIILTTLIQNNDNETGI